MDFTFWRKGVLKRLQLHKRKSKNMNDDFLLKYTSTKQQICCQSETRALWWSYISEKFLVESQSGLFSSQNEIYPFWRRFKLAQIQSNPSISHSAIDMMSFELRGIFLIADIPLCLCTLFCDINMFLLFLLCNCNRFNTPFRQNVKSMSCFY
jgi:hypothetical protein